MPQLTNLMEALQCLLFHYLEERFAHGAHQLDWEANAEFFASSPDDEPETGTLPPAHAFARVAVSRAQRASRQTRATPSTCRGRPICWCASTRC